MLNWKAFVCCFVLILSSQIGLAEEKAIWDKSLKNGEQAQKALQQCRLYLTGWLSTRDPKSGLIPPEPERLSVLECPGFSSR